jgi:hypothetical protein
MAEDLPNVTTVRTPLTGEPLEDHDRILEKRRRERPRPRPEAADEAESDEAEEEPLLDDQDDEEPHKLDVKA